MIVLKAFAFATLLRAATFAAEAPALEAGVMPLELASPKAQAAIREMVSASKAQGVGDSAKFAVIDQAGHVKAMAGSEDEARQAATEGEVVVKTDQAHPDVAPRVETPAARAFPKPHSEPKPRLESKPRVEARSRADAKGHAEPVAPTLETARKNRDDATTALKLYEGLLSDARWRERLTFGLFYGDYVRSFEATTTRLRREEAAAKAAYEAALLEPTR